MTATIRSRPGRSVQEFIVLQKNLSIGYFTFHIEPLTPYSGSYSGEFSLMHKIDFIVFSNLYKGHIAAITTPMGSCSSNDLSRSGPRPFLPSGEQGLMGTHLDTRVWDRSHIPMV